MNQARVILALFPGSHRRCTSQVGRPDDGTDTTGFFNTEYFVDLKPKEEWRPVFHQNKEELIAAMDRELEKIPGVLLEFLAAHRRQHGRSRQRRERRTRHQDLRRRSEDVLEEKGDQIVDVMRRIHGHRGSGLVPRHRPAEPEFHGRPRQAARYQINVADVQDAIQTAVGGNALTQVLQGEQRYDLAAALSAAYRDTKEAIENIRLRVALRRARLAGAALQHAKSRDGASEIYREANSRYVAIKYSVRGRDLGSAVEEAMKQGQRTGQTAAGYHIDWAGEYESQKRSQRRLLIVLPITILVIFIDSLHHVHVHSNGRC